MLSAGDHAWLRRALHESRGQAISCNDESPQPASADEDPPWVVGVGASAGGLEALQLFLQNVPPRCGVAFVVV